MGTAPPSSTEDDAPYKSGSSAEAQRRALSEALAGRYELERELGRGGMATVYLAHDLRHRRRVALKVLYPELSAAVGAKRFLREIEVTAGLTHPHILPLHDSGAAGDLLFYVMPWVDGESLAQRLERERQLPVDDAVRIACDVASALDYAHRHGVVHRDIKPANILLHEGRAFVADFGVAGALERAADGTSLTLTGTAVGTPQYMSPEQAAGERDLDARTDVFALGCVLYEMLAGSPPFVGPTAQVVIAKVLAGIPRPITDDRRAVPPHVATAIMRALEKVPADRFPTAAQFAAALSSSPAGAHHSTGHLPAPSPSAPARSRILRPTVRDAVWAAIAATVAVASYAAATREEERTPAGGATRVLLPIADSQRVAGAPGLVAFAPDGRSLIYVGEAGPGRRILYRRALDDMTVTPIRGTEGASTPFFSPDGRWIAFHDGVGGLRKIPAAGGTSEKIGDLAPGSARAWGPGDIIVGGTPNGLVRVSAAGGAPSRLTTANIAAGEIRHADPMFLPDGKTIAFRVSVSGDVDVSRIGLVTADGPFSADAPPSPYTTLDVRGGTPLGYVDGMLIVGHPDGTVAAIPIDYRRRRVTGRPIPLLDGVVYSRGASAAVSPDGALVYVRGPGGTRLALADARGSVVGGLREHRRYQYPRVSPDGGRIAMQIVSAEAAGSDIWIYDLDSGVLSRLTSAAGASRPVWTSDGKHIAYIAEGGERPGEVWVVPADRSAPAMRLYATPPPAVGVSELEFSRNGRFAVLRIGEGPPRTNDLWILPLDSTGRAAPSGATRLMETPYSEAMPRVSPDGRWLAYISDETGMYEVYVRPFPGPGGRTQVSTGGGSEPVWVSGGRRLVYRTGDRFMAATLTPSVATSGSGIAVTNREVLFEARYRSALPIIGPAQYDAIDDGRRFVVLPPTSDASEVVLVLDWFSEIRAKVAAAGR